MDVVVSQERLKETRIWDSATASFLTSKFPLALQDHSLRIAFGVTGEDRATTLGFCGPIYYECYRWSKTNWRLNTSSLTPNPKDQIFFADISASGVGEMIVGELD